MREVGREEEDDGFAAAAASRASATVNWALGAFGAMLFCSSIVAALSSTEIMSLGVIPVTADGMVLPLLLVDAKAALGELEDGPAAAISITPVKRLRNIVALTAMEVTLFDTDWDAAGTGPANLIIDCGILTGGSLDPG